MSFLNTRCNAFTVIGDCLANKDSLAKAGKYYEQELELTIETNDPDFNSYINWRREGVNRRREGYRYSIWY